MCCRYFIKETDPDMETILAEAEKSPLLARYLKTRATALVRSGEVFPSNLAAVLATNWQMQPTVFPMTWGFTAEGRKAPIINARVETASEKPTFQEAWKKHRCAIPASWYYEWQHAPSEDGRTTVKTKYAIQPCDVTVTWLCGLYRIENGLPQFVVLTSEASEDISFIHDRMPVILPKGAIREWVNPDASPADLLRYALTKFVAEKAK